MIYVLCDTVGYYYDIYEIISIYYPNEKIEEAHDESAIAEESLFIRCSIAKDEKDVIVKSALLREKASGNEEIAASFDCCTNETSSEKDIKHCVKLSVFKLLRDATGIEMPWGILVGIRPSKIVNELKLKGADIKTINNTLKSKYLMRDDKIRLVESISDNSFKLINNDSRKVSVYIGIPFCPSRCIYCSFASYPIQKYAHWLDKYMEALEYDIRQTARYIKGRFHVESIYIGGGTPTALSDDLFKKLLNIVSESFNVANIKEYTVEAGRPDTINMIKLNSMKSMGVNRISINPQSMNDSTLKAIGRSHTVADIIEKFHLARALGFDNINMDMILGLPAENLEYVKQTLKMILDLSPENITVHTMAVKRASRLREKLIEHEMVQMASRNVIEEMMDYVEKTMGNSGYIPYYMYRQKMMVGNLENVGYCRKGYECIYNIQMIEEKETIIGCGADSVTKLVYLDENRIERIANKKDIAEYINTICQAVGKKLKGLETII